MRICVVVTARPSWAKLQPVCEALRAQPEVELQIVACASALLERYGRVVDVIRSQGFSIAAEVWSTLEGANLITSAKETGGLLIELAHVLSRVRSDVVVVCADRHEVLGVAQAASYQHLRLAHLQGGERTGSIDDRVRDSITALADYHFTATQFARFRVTCLTGAYDRVWHTGCPSIDMAKRAQAEPAVTQQELGGAGVGLNPLQPFVCLLQHPTTDRHQDSHEELIASLRACQRVQMPTLVLWPGQDAGMEGASKAIREAQDWVHTVRNLPPARFLRLLTQASVLVGNSSAGIRECSYLGVPVVNVGSRQQGRERAGNVIDVSHNIGHFLFAGDWCDAIADDIAHAVRQQIAHGRYPSSTLYGRGDAGEQIAERLMYVCAGADSCASRQ